MKRIFRERGEAGEFVRLRPENGDHEDLSLQFISVKDLISLLSSLHSSPLSHSFLFLSSPLPLYLSSFIYLFFSLISFLPTPLFLSSSLPFPSFTYSSPLSHSFLFSSSSLPLYLLFLSFTFLPFIILLPRDRFFFPFLLLFYFLLFCLFSFSFL